MQVLLEVHFVHLVVLCCVGYAGKFAIYYCKVWLTESHQSYYQVTAYRSYMSASSMGYTVMQVVTQIGEVWKSCYG